MDKLIEIQHRERYLFIFCDNTLNVVVVFIEPNIYLPYLLDFSKLLQVPNTPFGHHYGRKPKYPNK